MQPRKRTGGWSGIFNPEEISETEESQTDPQMIRPEFAEEETGRHVIHDSPSEGVSEATQMVSMEPLMAALAVNQDEQEHTTRSPLPSLERTAPPSKGAEMPRARVSPEPATHHRDERARAEAPVSASKPAKPNDVPERRVRAVREIVRAESTREPKLEIKSESRAASGESSSSGEGHRKLQLPLPGNAPKKSAQPLPETAPVDTPQATERPASKKSSSMTVDTPEPKFSAAELLDRFSEASPSDDARKGINWSEYRELIATAAIGAFLVGGGIVYQLVRKDPVAQKPQLVDLSHLPGRRPVSAPKTAPAAPPPLPAPETAQVAGARRTAPPVEVASEGNEEAPEEGEVVKTARPMVTILSTPAGATVEINGVVSGKTPLIVPGPTNMAELSVRLRLEKFKDVTQDVTASESGHFNFSAKLEPR